MKLRRKSPLQTVKGHCIPAPRLTKWGLYYLCLYVIAPFLGSLLMLDIILYCIFKFGFNTCYGLLCYLS